MGSGVDKYDVENTIYELLIEEKPVGDVAVKDTNGKYHLIAANADATAAEIKLMEVLRGNCVYVMRLKPFRTATTISLSTVRHR